MLHIPIMHAHDVANKSLEKKIFHRVENVIKQLVHMSAVRSSRYEALGKLKSTQEVRVAHLSCSPNFLRASYLEERTLTYEPIVNQCALIKKLSNIALKGVKSLRFF